MAAFDNMTLSDYRRRVSSATFGLTGDHRIKTTTVDSLLRIIIVEDVHLILPILITQQYFSSL